MTTAEMRIARWRETLDPNGLWPETTADQRLAAYQQILTATGQVLAGQPGRLEAATGSATRALGIAAFLSGMGPMLGWWIEQGVIAAPPSVAELLAEHLVHGRLRVPRATEHLRAVLAALSRRGIIPVVLKGSYTARRYFPDPAARSAADADLLVTPDQFPAARETLRALGMACLTRHTRPQREEWGPPGPLPVQSIELRHEANPLVVDLHQSLDRTYFPGVIAGLGSPASADLAPWDSPFGPTRVLAQPFLAAHLALHAGSDFPDGQLVRIVELVLVLRQDTAAGALALDPLRALLRRTNTERFAYPAFQMAATLSPEAVDPGLLGDLASATTPRMRDAVAACFHSLPFHSGRKSIQLHLVWAKGPCQVARKLLDLAYPTGPDISLRDRLRIWRRRLGFLASGRVGWRAGAP